MQIYLSVHSAETGLEALSMPLTGNPEVHDCGRQLTASDLPHARITHLRHLWHQQEWRRLTAVELAVQQATLDSVWDCLPDRWIELRLGFEPKYIGTLTSCAAHTALTSSPEPDQEERKRCLNDKIHIDPVRVDPE